MIPNFFSFRKATCALPFFNKKINVWGKNNFSWAGTNGLIKKKLITNFVFYPPEIPCIHDNNAEEYTIIYEKDFEKIIYTWRYPTLDATWFALKLYNKLLPLVSPNKKDALLESTKRAHQAAINILKECITDNLFCIGPNNKNVSLHSIHSAIGIIKTIMAGTDTECDWNSCCEKNTITSFLYDQLHLNKNAKKIEESIIFYIQKCARDALTFEPIATEQKTVSAGYTDAIDGKIPTITATASALWCLWQLQKSETLNANSIQTFIKSLIKIYKENEPLVGFTNSILESDSLICATYYALRTLYSLQESGEKIDALLDEETRNGIKNFILNNIVMGGVSPKIGALPTIIHTKDAFALMQKKYMIFNFEKEKTIEKVGSLLANLDKYWKTCSFDAQNPFVGFSSHSFYYPNIYATLLLKDIDSYIQSINFKAVQKKVNKIFTKESSDMCISFLDSCQMNQNYEHYQPGFRCYSYDPHYIPNSFLERLSS